MTNPLTSVIILSFRQHDLTIACLESLIRLSSPLATIIVCDNLSPKLGREAILAWGIKQFGKKKVEIIDDKFTDKPARQVKFVFIQNKANVGFAQGNNPGIRYALANRSDFIWLLNNDTTVHPEALKQLLHCEKVDKKHIIGSTIVFDYDQTTVQCAGGCAYNPLTTVFKPQLAGLTLKEAVTRNNTTPHLDYIYGASFFVQRQVFEQCRLLNEEYFLFYEEIDLCMKARKSGFKIGWCRDSIVYHKGNQSVGKPDSGDKKKISFANYHENLSTLLFTRNFYPFLLPFTIFFRFFGKLIMIFKRKEFYLTKPLFHAFRDFFACRNQRENYKG